MHRHYEVQMQSAANPGPRETRLLRAGQCGPPLAAISRLAARLMLRLPHETFIPPYLSEATVMEESPVHIARMR